MSTPVCHGLPALRSPAAVWLKYGAFRHWAALGLMQLRSHRCYTCMFIVCRARRLLLRMQLPTSQAQARPCCTIASSGICHGQARLSSTGEHRSWHSTFFVILSTAIWSRARPTFLYPWQILNLCVYAVRMRSLLQRCLRTARWQHNACEVAHYNSHAHHHAGQSCTG